MQIHFPRPISETTVISKRPQSDDLAPEQLSHLVKHAADTLLVVRQFLENTDVSSMSISDVLTACGFTSEIYHEALKNASKNTTIFLKRTTTDVCINNYNPDILKAWEANMDLQFVSNAYACIEYVVGYITKDEREMGTLLQAVSKREYRQGIKGADEEMWQSFHQSPCNEST